MPLDAANFLARIVALLLGPIGVSYALCTNDQGTGRGVAPQFDAGTVTQLGNPWEASATCSRS
jgi:hypothetical protein